MTTDPADDTPVPAKGAPTREPEAAAPQVAAQMPAWPSITHKLRYPLAPPRVSAPVTEITLYEPDLEAMEKIEGLGFDVTAGEDMKLSVKLLRPIIAALSGLPEGDIKKLHMKDVMAVAEKLGPLLESLATEAPRS